MKTNLVFDTVDEQDDYILSLPLKDLKGINKKNKFLFQNKGEIVPEPEFENPDLVAFDEYIQKLQLTELKKLFESKSSIIQLDEVTIAEKVKITGLDRNVILIIETKKEKATLEQIMTYCKQLHIPYQQLIPEFFIPIY
jgi:hypothetical protein